METRPHYEYLKSAVPSVRLKGGGQGRSIGIFFRIYYITIVMYRRIGIINRGLELFKISFKVFQVALILAFTDSSL